MLLWTEMIVLLKLNEERETPQFTFRFKPKEYRVKERQTDSHDVGIYLTLINQGGRKWCFLWFILVSLSTIQTILVHLVMMDWFVINKLWRSGKKRSWCSRRSILKFNSGVWAKATKIATKLSSVKIESWTENLLYTSLQYCWPTILLDNIIWYFLSRQFHSKNLAAVDVFS
jgi:hypothetical protein